MNALALPEPFASADCGAHTEYGRRVVSWNIPGPGELMRNGYERCWVEITEREPWRGEPLWLSATRRPTGHESWGRVAFTDRGREQLAALLLPLVARFGFSRLWLDLHRRQTAGGWHEAQRQAEAEARWWEERSDLAAMHADGLVEFRPWKDPDGHRALTQPVLNQPGRPDYEQVAAEALLDGVRIGWMTVRGNLVPDRHMLDGTA